MNQTLVLTGKHAELLESMRRVCFTYHSVDADNIVEVLEQAEKDYPTLEVVQTPIDGGKIAIRFIDRQIKAQKSRLSAVKIAKIKLGIDPKTRGKAPKNSEYAALTRKIESMDREGIINLLVEMHKEGLFAKYERAFGESGVYAINMLFSNNTGMLTTTFNIDREYIKRRASKC